MIGVSSATTDGDDTSSANVSIIVALDSSATDGLDASASNVSPIVGADAANTDSADISAANVDPQSDVISASSETTNGADIGSVNILLLTTLDMHDGNSNVERDWRNKSRDELHALITRLVKGEFPKTEVEQAPEFVNQAIKAAPKEISEKAIQQIVAKVSAQIAIQKAKDDADEEESLFLLMS